MDADNANDGNGADGSKHDNRNLVIGALRGHAHRRCNLLTVLERGDNMFMEFTRRVNHGDNFSAAARVAAAREV